MIPIQDVVPSTRQPVVTIALLGLNVAVFLYSYATAVEGPGALAVSLFTHSGAAHFAFNALFLWLFGDNVEDRLGRTALALCYLACGTVGAFAQATLAGHDASPSVGATAAIAGIIGAYFVLLPSSKVLIFVPVPLSLVEVPAVFFLAMFWVLQFLVFVVTPTATGLDSSPPEALIALVVAFGCGALISVMLRRPVRW